MYWNFGSKLLIWNITGVGKVGGGICGEVSQETGDNFRYPSAKREPGGQCPWPPQPHSPEPSGMALTKVGSIFTEAVGLVSFPRPFCISAWNRAMMSKRVSSERRMWYRNLSTWNRVQSDQGWRLGAPALHSRLLIPTSGRKLHS